VLSPRAALVFSPAEQHAIRFTYNRAFSTPTSLNMFLDINGGMAPSTLGTLGYFVRATGPGENGLTFQNAQAGYSMRSPFNAAGAAAVQTVSSQNLWNNAVNLMLARGAISPAQAAGFRMLNASGVGIHAFNPVTTPAGQQGPLLSAAPVQNVPRMDESTTETFEVGYQGVIENRVALAADAWRSTRKNFTSPLTLWTPLLLLDATQMVQMLVTQAGMPPAQAQAIAAQIAPAPLGVITDPTVPTLGADIITTYVNYGELDLWGADLNVTAFLNPEWTLGLTGSIVSDDYFTPELFGVEQIVALNAPEYKATGTLGYRGLDNGFMGEVRGRFTSSFPASSADYQGLRCIGVEGPLVQDCVAEAVIVDLTAGFEVPNTGATVQLYVSNLFNEDYRNFVGVPNIGRLAMVQLKYDF
jgi:iron complex outermembrane receptor protein